MFIILYIQHHHNKYKHLFHHILSNGLTWNHNLFRHHFRHICDILQNLHIGNILTNRHRRRHHTNLHFHYCLFLYNWNIYLLHYIKNNRVQQKNLGRCNENIFLYHHILNKKIYHLHLHYKPQKLHC